MNKKNSIFYLNTDYKSMHYFWLILFWLISSYLPLKGNSFEQSFDQPWRITSYVEQGTLSQRNFHHISFEADGTAWISTSEDLIKYDGYNWSLFSTEHGLPSRFIRSTLITRDESLWVATDQGAGIFNRNEFKTHYTEQNLAGPSVRRIYEDSSGTLWFASDHWPLKNSSAGITKYTNNHWDIYGVNDGLPSDHILEIFEDSNNSIYALTQQGLAKYLDQEWYNPLAKAGFSSEHPISIAESKIHGLIVSHHLSIFIKKNDEWKQYSHLELFPTETHLYGIHLTSTQNDEIIAVAHTGKKRARFFLWNGDHFKPASADFVYYDDIRHIKESPDGSIWSCGLNQLVRWDRSTVPWQNYQNISIPKTPNKRNIWWKHDETFLVQFLFHTEEQSFYVDKDFQIWNCSNNKPEKVPESQYIILSQKETQLERIYFCEIDQTGTAWIIGRDESNEHHMIISPNPYQWESQPLPSEQYNRVYSIAPDLDSGIWMLCMDQNTGYFRLYKCDTNTQETREVFSSLTPYAQPDINIDSEGNMWLYGAFGIYKWSKTSNRWLDKTFPMARTSRFSIVQDQAIWFTLNAYTGGKSGLGVYRNQTRKHFEENVEMVGDTTTNGTIGFGGKNYYYKIEPTENAIPISIALPEDNIVNDITIDMKGNTWLEIGDSIYRHRRNKILPETQVSLSSQQLQMGEPLDIQFTGIKRWKPINSKYQFRYYWKIDNDNWSMYDSSHSLQLTTGNLSVGEHTIEVFAMDEHNNQDLTPAIAQFVIQPIPIQNQSWFLPTVFGIISIILTLFIFALISRLQVKHYAVNLELMVDKRTKELNTTQNHIIMISEHEQYRIGQELHDDVVQELVGVALYLEVLIQNIKDKSHTKEHDLMKIINKVDNAIRKTRRISYGLSPVNLDRLGLISGIQCLINEIENFYGIKCYFNCDNEVILKDNNQQLNLFRITQEAINNVVKHANAKELFIKLLQSKDQLLLEVKDYGLGINNPENANGMGLQIMKYRAKNIGAHLKIDSKEGSGTTVTCVLPLSYDE